jgi:hypothetical protein
LRATAGAASLAVAFTVQRSAAAASPGAPPSPRPPPDRTGYFASPTHTPAAPALPPSSVAELRPLAAGGKPLPAAERAFFEPRFGRSLDAVRLYDSPAAAESAHAFGARAYTFGANVVLGDGGRGARRVLAHELVHVVQQQPAAVPALGGLAPAHPALRLRRAGLSLQRDLPEPGTQRAGAPCTPAQLQQRTESCCNAAMLTALHQTRATAATRVRAAIPLVVTAAAAGPLRAHFRIAPTDAGALDVQVKLNQALSALSSGRVLFLCRPAGGGAGCDEGVRALSSNNNSGTGACGFCGNFTDTTRAFLSAPEQPHPLRTMIHEFVHIGSSGGILGAGAETSYTSASVPAAVVNPLANADCYAHLVMDLVPTP